MSKHTNHKTLKLGAYYAVLSVVVIAVVIAVNLLIGELPSTLTKFDTSGNQIYTLSEQSESIARNLKDVNRYTALNSLIKFKQVDPLLNPQFVKNYTDNEVNSNSLIVESAKRSYVVDSSEIFTTEYDQEELYMYYYYNGPYPTAIEYFNGESLLTTALDYVTSDVLPKLYIVGGHGESALSEQVLEYIKKENLQTADLNLSLIHI